MVPPANQQFLTRVLEEWETYWSKRRRALAEFGHTALPFHPKKSARFVPLYSDNDKNRAVEIAPLPCSKAIRIGSLLLPSPACVGSSPIFFIPGDDVGTFSFRIMIHPWSSSLFLFLSFHAHMYYYYVVSCDIPPSEAAFTVPFLSFIGGEQFCNTGFVPKMRYFSASQFE